MKTIDPEQVAREAAVDLEVLTSDISDLITELKEWGHVCETVVSVLNDVEGALTAEDFSGAIHDALNNLRLVDWSSPRRMEFLLPGALDEIENRLDELHTCMPEPEPELPFSVGLGGESPVRLRRFATEDEAAEFIGTLEGAEDGRYYLDGPER